MTEWIKTQDLLPKEDKIVKVRYESPHYERNIRVYYVHTTEGYLCNGCWLLKNNKGVYALPHANEIITEWMDEEIIK